MTMKPEFGYVVVVDAVLKRQKKFDESVGLTGALKVVWEREKLAIPRKALYIGKRTVYEGRIDRIYNDDMFSDSWYNEFTRTHAVTVYLVVFNENHNPVYALPEDVHITTQVKW